MSNNKLSVSVRMYRQGLGDCFLITFKKEGQKDFNMLVDCGIFFATTKGPDIMKSVAKNIKKDTNSYLDVVALSHDHYDHTAGFWMAKKIFDEITFEKVWLGWTEDQNHPQFKSVRDEFSIYSKGIRAALEHKQIETDEFEAWRETVNSLVNEFFGIKKKNKKVLEDNSRTWDYILKKDNAQKTFCTPGKILNLDGLEDDVRVYILGPPEKTELFTAKEPTTKAEREAESYRHFLGTALAESFLAASDKNTDVFDSEAYLPFDKRFQIETGRALRQKYFRETYGSAKNENLNWRQIEEDWLLAAGNLALRLDSYTNNTCLAFAIELIESGKVLIFPGDAQFGNWYSWKDLEWEIEDKKTKKTKKIVAKDLLNRCILYKVGHHGSHNATLKKHGLEMMGYPEFSNDLVAMVPTDRRFARSKTTKKNPAGWEMPDENLEKDLLKRTRGRVILADEVGSLVSEKQMKTPFKKKCEDISAGGLSKSELDDFLDNKIKFSNETFLRYPPKKKDENGNEIAESPKEEPLYIEYEIKG